ncbi:hypothetical protein [Arabidopsis thaliana]|uniref:Uncharacterized protein AT4g23330 n=1 Tax=Arabidopsis thaliana TaxID=3702 RepID=O65484_ARATH|nr:hypothetical protein [Arabidopsis thaliana]CAA20454.1 hypothetical protein [Arabidopsis thaliana]CAB79288.1 hypothetical protein [Arabidopsis thaliana]
MDAGAEIDVVRPVEADSAAEISPEQDHEGRSEPSSLNQGEILKTLATVEKDSQAIAESFSSLFVSLRSTLSEATGSSVDHMACFGEAAGRLQENALDAATKGNRYINSCLRLWITYFSYIKILIIKLMMPKNSKLTFRSLSKSLSLFGSSSPARLNLWFLWIGFVSVRTESSTISPLADALEEEALDVDDFEADKKPEDLQPSVVYQQRLLEERKIYENEQQREVERLKSDLKEKKRLARMLDNKVSWLVKLCLLYLHM